MKSWPEGRITPQELKSAGVKNILDKIRRQKGYYVTNAERDLSQSDLKNRIMPHTQILVAPERNTAGFFSLEITGGASVHVDMLRKQMNPLEKLEVLAGYMPDTLFQTLCRGINLFGYRPYPENVIRLTVETFARYVHVWRVFDFLNYIPNMIPVYEEVKKAGRILEAAVCFSTGPEHTNKFYIKKVGEILDITGPDIILAIKNHGGLGSPRRIGDLVRAILQKYPDLLIHYHGHNTDGNEIGRVVAAVQNGAKIIDAGDHALTGFYGPPPMLTVVNTLEDYGFTAIGLDRQALIDASNKLRHERPYYRDFESQFFGFDPTVQTHKLPGGATGSSFEQAQKGGFLDLMPEILQNELPRVQVELGNFWSVTPGSQILWTTAASNVLKRARYQDASDDLKNLLLERYGKFPFYRPDGDIYAAVLGKDWKKILKSEGGYQKIEDIDLAIEKRMLEKSLGRKATEDELVLYLQHPNDAVSFFKFEEKFGKTWALPPAVWLRRGGFNIGEKFEFPDAYGKLHTIEIGPMRRSKDGSYVTILGVDYHPEPVLTIIENEGQDKLKTKVTLTGKEIEALARAGDIRATMKGVVNQIPVAVSEAVSDGDTLVVLEAMKMLTNIASEVSGKVSEILVSPGSSVEIGDKLMMIEV